MNRQEFLKLLGLSIFIPSLGQTKASEQVSKGIKIYHNYLRGLAYYDIAYIYHKLKIGQVLELKREAQNRHDKYAIEVRYKGYKLGYIPRYENKVLAHLMDQGKQLTAVISRLNDTYSTYNSVGVSIYM